MPRGFGRVVPKESLYWSAVAIGFLVLIENFHDAVMDHPLASS
jgi:hypothetical protein